MIHRYLIFIVMGFTGFGTFALAQFSDELLSIDLAPNPQSGYVLTTDGTNNTWSVATGGSGGSDSLWALNTSGNYVYSDSASTTATTSARSYYFTATSTSDNSVFPLFTSTQATITSGTSTNWFSTVLTAATAYITSLVFDGETFDSLTDDVTLANNAGDLQVVDVTCTNCLGSTEISGIDISADTNLTADGTEIILTDDALSLGTALTYLTGTSSTSFYTGLLGVNSEYFSDLTGAGLQNSSGVLTLNATGDWTGTLDGFEGSALAQTNWSYNGSRLSPSTTVGMGVFASSTIGDGTATGGLTVNGSATSTGTTTARTLNVGNNGLTAQAGIVDAAGFINASTTGRSGVIFQNYGVGTAPEFRFIVGDPYVTTEYIAFGLTNQGATAGGAVQSLQKNDIVYVLSNTGRDLLVTAGGGVGTGNLYLGAGANALPLFKIDGTTNRVGINLATTTTPTSTLSVNGDIYYANSIATGTATSVNAIATAILRAPYGSAPTVVTNGDIGIDSTSNQFKYQSGGVTKVLGDGNVYPAFTYSTSTAWTGTTTIPLGPAFVAETWNAVRCFTDTGTVNVDFGDGTNFMNATTSKAVNPAPFHTLSTNNTFTAGETRYARVGTPVSSPQQISCTVSKSFTAD